jgi:hypothetical protein
LILFIYFSNIFVFFQNSRCTNHKGKIGLKGRRVENGRGIRVWHGGGEGALKRRGGWDKGREGWNVAWG